MITLIVFSLLSTIEFLIIYLKWNNVLDAHEFVKLVSSLSGFEKKYNYAIGKIIVYLKKIKPFLWIVIVLVMISNLIIAAIISGLYHLILFFT